MSDKEKLLSCPFCGGEGLRKSRHYCSDVQYDDDHDEFWDECKECGARTKAIHVANARYRNTCKEEFLRAENEADKLWNERT